MKPRLLKCPFCKTTPKPKLVNYIADYGLSYPHIRLKGYSLLCKCEKPPLSGKYLSDLAMSWNKFVKLTKSVMRQGFEEKKK